MGLVSQLSWFYLGVLLFLAKADFIEDFVHIIFKAFALLTSSFSGIWDCMAISYETLVERQCRKSLQHSLAWYL